MLDQIFYLGVIFVVAALITVDIVRASAEALVEQADWHAHDTGRSLAAARGVPGVHAFPREQAVRGKPVPDVAGARLGAGPAEVDSFERTDQATRASDQMRRETSQPTASEAALRGKFNAMYVNLSRRNQSLAERQLRLIESLQHGEHDQRRLASLTKLDRIAMRMHRNSQNLLVLAGREPVTGWTQPVTLANLVEAAVAEVEEYERVSFAVQPNIAVRGPAVHDAVHLLVELIENATAFSTAEMPVDVTGRILPSGGALVDITDRGIGMPAKEMAYANHQLDNPPPPDSDVPKWMGLLVVARLAAWHGIRVRLNQAESGGLTALVWFPDEILTHYSATADPGRAAEQRGAPIGPGPGAHASTRMNTQDVQAAQPHPAGSARSVQATVPAEAAAAVRLSGSARSDVLGGDVGVVMPQADSPARMHGPPIYDDVESRWPRGGHEAPSSAGSASSGPVASGLTRRPPTASAGSRAVPGTPPGAPNRSGLPTRQSWAAPAEETNPVGQDES